MNKGAEKETEKRHKKQNGGKTKIRKGRAPL